MNSGIGGICLQTHFLHGFLCHCGRSCISRGGGQYHHPPCGIRNVLFHITPPQSGAGFPFMYRGGQGRERKRRKERGRRGYIGPLLKRQRLPLHKGRYNPAFRLRLGPLTRHTPNRRQHGVKPVFPHSFPLTRSLASHWTQKIRWPHVGTSGRSRFNLFNWLSRKGRKKEPVL